MRLNSRVDSLGNRPGFGSLFRLQREEPIEQWTGLLQVFDYGCALEEGVSVNEESGDLVEGIDFLVPGRVVFVLLEIDWLVEVGDAFEVEGYSDSVGGSGPPKCIQAWLIHFSI